MVNFAICDDEAFMLDETASKIERFMNGKGHRFKLTRFSDGASLLESRESFDVVFLDIQMKHPDGMETAKLLRQKGWHGLLIFLTVLRENVFESFDVGAFGYLLKPLDDSHFLNTMERVLGAILPRNGKRLPVRNGNSFCTIPFSELAYCEVRGRKLYLHLCDGTISDYYGRLDDFELQLDSRFFRCHRSYVVNLDEVRKYVRGSAVLSDGSIIPVSRKRGRGFADALLERMREV